MDATAPPSYRQPPPRLPTPPDDSQSREPPPPPRRSRSAGGQDPSCSVNRLEFEHRVREKKTKYRPLLGVAMDDPKRFVPFVLEASGWLGPETGAFLEYLSRYCISVPSWACSPLSITRGWHCDGRGSSATLSSVAGLIAFKTFAHASLT